MRRVLLALSLCVSVVILTPTAMPASAAALPDAGQVGPYAIGHVSLMLSDPDRQCDIGNRPIPVEVFYPVDPATISPATPEAVYPLDPINGVWPPTVSSDWVAVGNDPAYEGAAPSSDKPFPLVVFSPGWGAPIWAHNFLAGRVASHGFVFLICMFHPPSYKFQVLRRSAVQRFPLFLFHASRSRGGSKA